MENISLQNNRQNEYLARQLETGQFVGFMLFVGQKGSRKYDAALNFGKSVLCSASETEFCGNCPDCKLAEAGNHPDLIKIGGAKSQTLHGGEESIKIAEIRELQKKLCLKPYQAEHKVVIIENAHLMTEESANALLKILEEPPEDTLIILTAPDKKMLPDTVVSRSQIVNFGASKEDFEMSEEMSGQVSKILEVKGDLAERFKILADYGSDRGKVYEFFDSLETVLRNVILSGKIPEKNIIEKLEMVQKSRQYIKNNLSAKFVLENLIINLQMYE